MQEFDRKFWDDFKPQPVAQRRRLRRPLLCALVGGAYGAAVGSIVSVNPDAVSPIAVAAGIMVLLCQVPAGKLGLLLALVSRRQIAGLPVRIVAAIGGAILGGYFGVVATALPGSLIGAVGGWFAARALAAIWKLLAGLFGMFLGACLGAIVQEVTRGQAAALPGALLGAAVGIPAGVLLLLLYHAGLRWLFRPRRP